jgi:tetratricopeptide (TPR) repeat protein
VKLDTLNFDVALAVSGRVLLLEERQPPPEPVPVEYLCHGASLGALTDAKGRFSIPFGSQQATRTNLYTASIDIEGCRVEIRVPGFEEVVVTLKQPKRVSDLDLGDLTLKSIGVQGDAGFSATGRNAPGKARSHYLAAFETIKVGNYPQALVSLDKAIAAYPKYASALQLKGAVLERMGQRDAAREAYQQAVAADPAYAKPLVQLAEMAAQEQNPTEAARWAAMANHLVRGAFPSMFLIEGSAYFDLHRYDDAEKAAREGIDADPKSIYPGLRKLMGEVLYQKRSYAAALDLFEWYLKEAPMAADIVDVQGRVQSCKRLIKTPSR